MPIASRTYDPSFLLRPFTISVQGHAPATYYSTSRNKALSSSWQDYCSALGHVPFKDFLKMAKAGKAEPAERFGDPILVGGRQAFYVSYNGHYVQFALPHGHSFSNTHPADVTLASGEPFTR